jgi:serine/threonine protein phosphatase PrpC
MKWDAILKERDEIALFAAATLMPGRVSVCTAGDIRVHLASHGRLRAFTRDHTYDNDPAFSPSAELPSQLRRHVATRSLGTGAMAEPEATQWDAPGAYSVLICSSQLHRHRPPAEYFEDLNTGGSNHLADTEGFLCRIHVTGA